jgi:hypothetical protein
MHSIRLILLLISVLFTNACAALTITPEKKVDSEAPAIMLKLPKTVESCDKYFNDGSGYSIRYSNERKQRLADLYIYDVAEENASLDHKQLVLGSTKATMDAIGAAAKQGHYANYSVLNAAMHAQGLRTVARVQATYLRQNLASYTLVYQTEYKGTLLKIRVTMPDNDSNRNSREWDLFTDTVFQSVISELDSTSMEQADSTESSEL